MKCNQTPPNGFFSQIFTWKPFLFYHLFHFSNQTQVKNISDKSCKTKLQVAPVPYSSLNYSPNNECKFSQLIFMWKNDVFRAEKQAWEIQYTITCGLPKNSPPIIFLIVST